MPEPALGRATPIVLWLEKLDEAGNLGFFATSQDGTTKPTLSFGTVIPASFRSGIIRRIHYRLNPTNAVTYTLRLWVATWTANTYQLNLYKLYQSPAAQADDTEYDREVVISFLLGVPAFIYYSIEWTGAPGVTPGYIHLTGEAWE